MTKGEQAMLMELLTKYNNERTVTGVQSNMHSQQPNMQLQQALNEVQQLRQEITQLKSVIGGAQSNAGQAGSVQNTGNDIDALVKMMMNSMQGQNISGMSMPQPQSVDDVIAEIINPPLPEFGKEMNGAQYTGGINIGSK